MRYFNISDVGSVSFAVSIRMTLSAVLSERSCPGFYIGMLSLWEGVRDAAPKHESTGCG